MLFPPFYSAVIQLDILAFRKISKMVVVVKEDASLRQVSFDCADVVAAPKLMDIASGAWFVRATREASQIINYRRSIVIRLVQRTNLSTGDARKEL